MARDADGPFGGLESLKSDPNSTAARLEPVADKLIEAFWPDRQRISILFAGSVAAQASLAQQLFGEAMVAAKAREWLAGYLNKRSAKAEGAAIHGAPQGQSAIAAPEQSAPRAREILPQGHNSSAPDAEPINGGGQPAGADKAIRQLPPSVDPKSSGGGHPGAAAKAAGALPPSARPQSQSDIRAAGKAAKVIALTAFDKIVMRDGKPIGDLHYSELARYRREDLRSAALLDRIESHVQPAPGTDPVVRLLISAETLERFAGMRNAA